MIYNLNAIICANKELTKFIWAFLSSPCTLTKPADH